MESLAQSTSRNGCPGRRTLVDFNLGKLAVTDLEAVADHLSSCAQCGTILHNLQYREAVADRVLDQLKRCLGRPPLAEDSACRRMAAEAEAIGSPATQWSTDPQVERPGAAEALIGRLIGRYAVLDRIGEGGMGVVYRARQLPIDRPVALKVILAGVHAGAQLLARFDIEGKAVARLRHTNVVQIHEFGNHEGLPYYSMELVEGGSLEAELAKGPLEPHRAAELVRTLAATVEYAHQKQVLHRDLKPANVLLTEDGTPKIADFGLAKLLDVEEGGHTHTDMVLGTPSYMAPEQAEGLSKAIGPPADVYALGAILYAALTGHPPFLGQTKAKTLEMVRRAELVPPSRRRPGVPGALEAVCLKCLEKSPARRYASAQALADDLDLWLHDMAPRGIPRLPERVGRLLRRRAALVLIGSGLVAAAAGGTAALYLWDPERPVRQIQSELAAGRAVTLIGETGKPKWFRWQVGEAHSKLAAAPDGALTIHAGGLSLMELVPDPQTESYRIAARVRHEKSNRPGEVGLYFAHRVYPGGPADIHFFAQVTFNDVRGEIDPPVVVVRGQVKPLLSVVRLLLHLHSEEGTPPNVDWRIPGRDGPQFQPATEGEGKGQWHDLAVTVTPSGVTAEWDGQPLGLTRREIAQTVAQEIGQMRPRYPGDPFVQDLQPQFAVRGGLGLYLLRGSASFSAVTVAPLADAR